MYILSVEYVEFMKADLNSVFPWFYMLHYNNVEKLFELT